MTRLQPQTRCGSLLRGIMLLCLWAVPLAAQETPQEDVVPTVQPPTEEVKPASSDPDLLGSLFFTNTEREAIAQARRQYSSRGTQQESEQDLLDQLQGIMAAQKPEEDLQDKYYAQFFLKSLIYHTADDWVAWVKCSDLNKQFSPTNLSANDVGVKVIEVSSEKITFEWKPKDWISVTSAFKDNNPLIKLDQAARLVTFTLRVNQTLSATNMTITEGPVVLTPVDADKAGGKDSKADEKPLPEKAEPASGNVAANGEKTATGSANAPSKQPEMPDPKL